MYLKLFNKIIPNYYRSQYLHFSVYFLQIFVPGSGSRRENECGSMRIRIHSPAYYHQNIILLL